MIYGNPIIANFDSAPSNIWAELRASTRAGTAEVDFPVKSELPVTFDSNFLDTTAVIVGHDHYTPVNSNLTHTTVCQFKKVISAGNSGYGAQQIFDSKTPICTLTSGLTRSTSYYFTVPTTQGNWTSGTYKFSPMSDIPAGSKLYPLGTNWTNGPLFWQNHITRTSGTAGMMSSGTGTVDLSTMGVLDFSPTFYLGSTDYRTSMINELLNGPADYYSTLGKFITAGSFTTPLHGIYGSLSADIKPYITPVYVPYIRATDTSTTLTLDTQIFLPATVELNSEAAMQADGMVLDFYKDSTTTDRIKYDESGRASIYWTRTPTADTNQIEFVFTASGGLNAVNIISSGSSATNYIAPLFVIA